MTYRGEVNHMLAINEELEGLVADMVTTTHVGDVDVEKTADFRN